MEGKIYEAISNVMKDVGIVGKDSTNEYDRYKFRGIDAVMNALNPAMIKNRVFVAPTVLESHREERQGSKGTTMMYSVLTVKYTFYTDDGSFVECTVIGEAMDRSDKSTNKAMSAAFKYACFQTFCIPTEEMKDADAESPEIGTKSDEQKNKEMIDSVDKTMIPQGKKINKGQITKLKAEMDRTGVGEDVILPMFRVKALEELSDTDFVVLMNKFAITKDKANG